MSGASYDPGARRDTPLALKLKERIRRDGPITVEAYVVACLHDDAFGYYRHRPAIGTSADFVTAPEISQIFGELIGLWCAVTWQQMGMPPAFNLVEFGPGRGTMLRDALRAMRALPEALAAARVLLVDSSSTLRAAQSQVLGGQPVPVTWIDKLDVAETAHLPTILLGNEFLDTEPIEQFERGATGWVTRRVCLDRAERLAFMAGEAVSADVAKSLDQRFPDAKNGTIGELHSIDHEFFVALNLPSPRAALLIDYGHVHSGAGDTLQAVRNHAYEHPLASPGEADLTAQVDFQQVVEAFATGSMTVDGPVTQAEFLGSLGIMQRASRLMDKNPTKAPLIEAGVARLMSPTGMGSRFKAIGLRSPHLPPLPGFPVVDKSRSSP